MVFIEEGEVGANFIKFFPAGRAHLQMSVIGGSLIVRGGAGQGFDLFKREAFRGGHL